MSAPYHRDNHITIYNKDCRDISELPDNSVQCVVTSPPYFGLRKFTGDQELIWGDNHCEHQWGDELIVKRGHPGDKTTVVGTQTAQLSKSANDQGTFCSLCGAWKGQLGLEPTPELYLQHTIEILREIRRVLRKDGVVFWNIKDSYASKAGGYNDAGSRGKSDCISVKTRSAVLSGKRRQTPIGLKPKDLNLIPFHVAIAAQKDGWWVRSVIIWSKPNQMPESAKDRPTVSHEYILMLTKAAKYYWDQEAVREPQTGGAHSRGREASNQTYQEARGSYYGFRSPILNLPGGRNMRSVLTFPTEPFPSIKSDGGKVNRHFAVFPRRLPELCIKAATPEAGCCSKCGAPWTRVIKKGFTNHDGGTRTAYPEEGRSSARRLALLRQAARERGSEYQNVSETIEWKPTCKCNASRVPSLVLDPLMGSGTTLLVAKNLNRFAVGYELSEGYCQLAIERCRQQVLA